jgi:hypothetical protein
VNRNKKLPVITVAHRDEATRLAELPAERRSRRKTSPKRSRAA